MRKVVRYAWLFGLFVIMAMLCCSYLAKESLDNEQQYAHIHDSIPQAMRTLPGSPLSLKHLRQVKLAKGSNLHQTLSRPNIVYVIRHRHEFDSLLVIPSGCELHFKGGSLCGPIAFTDTYLSGSVRLQGSTVSGRVSNDVFHTSWLCRGDGISDDAPAINMALRVCDSLHVDYGPYRLKSMHTPSKELPEEYRQKIMCHIGIHDDNKHIKADSGAVLISDTIIGCIDIYSRPYDIANSVKSISIEGLRIVTKNNAVRFNQFAHAIGTRGVNGLLIKNCRIDDFWGDGICLSHYGDTPRTGERTRNMSVRIERNRITGGMHHSNRNGISVISGQNVIIVENTIMNTSRKDMPGAIDVEPNNAAYTIDRISIVRNRIKDCDGTAGGICIHTNGLGGPAHHLVVDGNHISNSFSGIAVVVKDSAKATDFMITNNIIDADTNPYQFVGDGYASDWLIKDNHFLGRSRQEMCGKIRVYNLRLQ